MKNKMELFNFNGTDVVDSREVAEMIDMRHTDLMRKIANYQTILENAKLRSQEFFISNTYKVEGNNKTYNCYLLTKKGCEMIANKLTGEKGVLFTATYVNTFNQMKEMIEQPYKLPQNYREALLQLVEQVEVNERLQSENISLNNKIEEQKPLVIFANQVGNTNDLLDMNEMAKILKDKNINIGRNRLMKYLRKKLILMSNNMPYQKYMNLGYFNVKEVAKEDALGVNVYPKTYVTGKGQHFIVDLLTKGVQKERGKI